MHAGFGGLGRHLELHRDRDTVRSNCLHRGYFIRQRSPYGSRICRCCREFILRKLHGDCWNGGRESRRDGDGVSEWQFHDGIPHSDRAGFYCFGIAVCPHLTGLGRHVDLLGDRIAGSSHGRICRRTFFQRCGSDSSLIGDRVERCDHRNLYGNRRHRDGESSSDGHGISEWQFRDGIPERNTSHGDDSAMLADVPNPGERLDVHRDALASGANGRLHGRAFLRE